MCRIIFCTFRIFCMFYIICIFYILCLFSIVCMVCIVCIVCYDKYPSKQTRVKSFKFQQVREWVSQLVSDMGRIWSDLGPIKKQNEIALQPLSWGTFRWKRAMNISTKTRSLKKKERLAPHHLKYRIRHRYRTAPIFFLFSLSRSIL